jgi:hypothetical protein
MSERVMVVTGAFATHTTKLYNYYVCPSSWDVTNVKYIAVNYFNELKYVGEILSEPINWNFDEENEIISGLFRNNLSPEITNDLEKFSAILNAGDHYLFILKPIINNSFIEETLSFKGKGAFTRSHRYFENLGDFFNAYQNVNTEDVTENNEVNSTINDGAENSFCESTYDTVIVPAGKTIREIKETNTYKQQLEKPFNTPIDFIAFYVKKRIVGYGKISKIKELTTHREYYIEKFIEIDIPHLERGYFVLFRKYTTLKNLLNAKTTKDIL